MVTVNWLILASGGLVSGILAGLLGIGGGVILVPILITLGYLPIQAIATSSLAILITSTSGSIQNLRMGYFDWKRVIFLGLPAAVSAQLGAYIASRVANPLLLAMFGVLLLTNIYLVQLRKRLAFQGTATNKTPQISPKLSRLITGGTAGILAGLFGVGGGVIMVPLQMLLLGEPIKVAIQTSLGVIVITAVSATIGHAFAGNVLLIPGLLLGGGGLLGAQISTRILPQLPDRVVSLIFRLFLAVLSIYMFWQAWMSYQST